VWVERCTGRRVLVSKAYIASEWLFGRFTGNRLEVEEQTQYKGTVV